MGGCISRKGRETAYKPSAANSLPQDSERSGHGGIGDNPYGSVGMHTRSEPTSSPLSHSANKKMTSIGDIDDSTELEKSPSSQTSTTISNRTNETIVRMPGTVQGAALALSNLTGSDVFIMDWSSQICVNDCSDTVFYIAPVAGAVNLHDCTNCRVHVVCHQLRLRTVSNTILSVLSPSGPTLERCHDIHVCCWQLSYWGLGKQIQAAGLTPFSNCWSKVFDYTSWNFQEAEEFQGKAHWSIAAEGSMCWPGKLHHQVPKAVADMFKGAPSDTLLVSRNLSQEEYEALEPEQYLFILLNSSCIDGCHIQDAPDSPVSRPTNDATITCIKRICKHCQILHCNKAKLSKTSLQKMAARDKGFPKYGSDDCNDWTDPYPVWGLEIKGGSSRIQEVSEHVLDIGGLVSPHHSTAFLFRELDPYLGQG